MEDSRESSPRLGESGAFGEMAGKVIAAGLIVFFLVVIFLFLFYIYSRWLSWRHGGDTSDSNRLVFASNRRRPAFAAVVQQVGERGRGLDPSVLSSIPIVIIDPKHFKDRSECAVCLCELSQGEKARLLNPCNHGFHVECIDMWFHSHSTCPLCRTLIVSSLPTLESNQSLPPPNPNSSTETPDFPTNVLIWGDQTQILSSTSVEVDSPPVSLPSQPSSSTGGKGLDGVLVIDIPSRKTTESSSVSSVWASPKSPIANGLRSLRRILSRDRRSFVLCSPSACPVDDLERGNPERLC